MRKGVICLLAATFLFQACGTLLHGTTQDLTVQSSPSGLTARIGSEECVTPCVLQDVPRNSSKLYLKKVNGKEKAYDLTNDREINGKSTFLGNLCCLWTGMLFDFPFGGAYTIRPVNVQFDDLK